MGIVTLFPAKETVGLPPAGFSPVTLQTADGVTLESWCKPPANGAVILLVHDAGGSRKGLRSYAEMIARHGYGVLALDLRGHGASSGRTNRMGWESTPDVGAAIQYLQGREGVKKIGGLGLSMGGEVLLGAASTCPALSAVAADGATRRCIEELLALPSERPLVSNFTSRVMFATVQILGNAAPPRPLLESMLEANSTRFLWIAAGSNTQEVAFNRLFAEAVGERGLLWIAPEAARTGAFGLYPGEYARRVIGFFDAALLGNSAP